MAYPTSHVANSLIQRGFKEARPDMSPMKLQKLLFFLHGWMLATTGRPAIDEDFRAWTYGPVAPTLYDKLKGFGSGSITQYVQDFDPYSRQFTALVVSDTQTDFQRALDLTWEKYIGISALSLSAMTHEANSPWDITYRSAGRDAAIPNDLIQRHFVAQANRGFSFAS
ncbi:type II toxin-antitoxin system antitoxin SocA domain-containing protein [Variovorax paradoxus]|jgi:uncharacterized phage-associated protein|uniref:Panacea domain-containing protein n=1 Tax=Variovorax paradoxus TaxID=34073 RepID=UPI003AB0AA5D